MKAGLAVVVLVLACAPLGLANDPPGYDKGALLSMDSSSCRNTQ
jgi:hypothetical protein